MSFWADGSAPSLRPPSEEEVLLEGVAGEAPLHALGTVHADTVHAERALFVIA